MNTSKLLNALKVAIPVLILAVAVSYVSAAWSVPPGSPPDCPAGYPGCDAPLNVGSTEQTKTGNLNLGGFLKIKKNLQVNTDLVAPATYGLDVWGISKFWGNVQIATGSPSLGKVLTALDSNGTVGWSTASGGGGTGGSIQMAQAFRRDIDSSGGPIMVLSGPTTAFEAVNNVSTPSPDLTSYTGLDGLKCATGWSVTGCWIVTHGDDADLFAYPNGCVTNDMDQSHSEVSISCINIPYSASGGTVPPPATLTGYCSANNSYPAVNTSVTWTATAGGGSGYSYSWTGTDGLSGSASTVTKTYTTTGTKTNNVVITSNGGATSGQQITRSCSVVVGGTPPPPGGDPEERCGGTTGILCN